MASRFKLFFRDEMLGIVRFICFPSICLWALFGSSIKMLIKNAKIKKIIEYFLAVLLIITAIIILFNYINGWYIRLYIR